MGFHHAKSTTRKRKSQRAGGGGEEKEQGIRVCQARYCVLHAVIYEEEQFRKCKRHQLILLKVQQLYGAFCMQSYMKKNNFTSVKSHQLILLKVQQLYGAFN